IPTFSEPGRDGTPTALSPLPVKLVHSLMTVVTFCLPSSVTAQTSNATVERVTIASALSEALQKNLDLIAKRAGLSLAAANPVTAQLRPNPVFSAGGDQLDLLGTGFNATNMAGPPEYTARVDYLLERGDKRAVRTAVAQEERDIAEADVDDATRTLALT